MSCSGESNFGYVKIEGDKVVSYTGAPEDPEIHKFCNDEIVQAMRIKEFVENRIKTVFYLMEEYVKNGQVYGKGITKADSDKYWNHVHEHHILSDMLVDSKI